MNVKVCVTPTSWFLFLACLVQGHVTIAFQQSKPCPCLLHHHPATLAEETQCHYVTTGTVMSDSHNTKYHETCQLWDYVPQTWFIFFWHRSFSFRSVWVTSSALSEYLLLTHRSILLGLIWVSSLTYLSIFLRLIIISSSEVSEYLPQTYLIIFFDISEYLPQAYLSIFWHIGVSSSTFRLQDCFYRYINILWCTRLYHTCRHIVPYLYLLHLSSCRWALGFEACTCRRHCEN